MAIGMPQAMLYMLNNLVLYSEMINMCVFVL